MDVSSASEFASLTNGERTREPTEAPRTAPASPRGAHERASEAAPLRCVARVASRLDCPELRARSLEVRVCCPPGEARDVDAAALGGLVGDRSGGQGLRGGGLDGDGVGACFRGEQGRGLAAPAVGAGTRGEAALYRPCCCRMPLFTRTALAAGHATRGID